MHGAHVISHRRATSTTALDAGARADRDAPDRARQLGQPVPHRGPEDRRLRDRARRSAARSTSLCIPVGNAGNITAYWRGFTRARATRAPRMFGFQAAGAAPLVLGRAGRAARDGRHARSASATRRAGRRRWPRDRLAAASSTPSATSEILDRLQAAGARGGRVLRARLGGVGRGPAEVRRRRAPQQVVCVLTGHGLKDPETAIANNDGGVIQCEPELSAIERVILR